MRALVVRTSIHVGVVVAAVIGLSSMDSQSVEKVIVVMASWGIEEEAEVKT
jgi:hypothetical protein